MSKFRLSWARRCGEKKAKEFGFDAFPIDPIAIADHEEIHVVPKSPDRPGVSGGIIFNGDNVGIFFSTDIESKGFQRFTVAHELGHYFLEGHPEEILKTAPLHVSRAGFTQGTNSIELEADHFASGLLLPTTLARNTLEKQQVGLVGVSKLADESHCSLTAAAIRAAECCPYPIAIVVSKDREVSYSFMSESFKKLGKLTYLRKGSPLPSGATKNFNANPDNVRLGLRECGQTTLSHWFDGPANVELDEEVVGLGGYGYTLSVLSSEELPDESDEDSDEETSLIDSYTPRFAYGR